jgi:hypothetical protein
VTGQADAIDATRELADRERQRGNFDRGEFFDAVAEVIEADEESRAARLLSGFVRRGKSEGE